MIKDLGPWLYFNNLPYLTVISEIYSTSNLRVRDLKIYVENLLCDKPRAGS